MFKKLRYFKADHSAYIQHEVQTMMRQAVHCIKQETLAYELGEDWTQKKVSQLEARETIDLDILEQVPAIVKISPEAIQRFNEGSAINIISSTLHDNAGSVNYNFNPLDKLIEAYGEKEKLHDENQKLYERLLQAEKDKVAYLERLLEGKKDA